MLRFADGSVVEADVVIGADGMRPVVRGRGRRGRAPEHPGLCAFRTPVPAALPGSPSAQPAPSDRAAPDGTSCTARIAAGEAVVLAQAGEDTDGSGRAAASVDELRAQSAHWDPRVRNLVAAAGGPGRRALLDRAPLRP